MLKEKESFRLLYQAIREIADKIGDNQLETNSVSLLLLDFDFEHEVFDELYLAILKYLNTVSIENISHSELLNLIENTIPEDREINTFVKNKIIIGFANNYFPALYEIVQSFFGAYCMGNNLTMKIRYRIGNRKC